MDPNCPICHGVNSASCYRCRGALTYTASRDNPWVCPICKHSPCICQPGPGH